MTPVTCATVEEQDLAARYLAGRLSADDGEAYEAHYFGCERCWAALQRAVEIRAAWAPRAVSGRARRWSLGRWWPLAAAAVVLLALGLWRSEEGDRVIPDGALRGVADSLVVRTTATAAGVTASWSPAPHADVYRFRLFAADGTLLLERQTADTVLGVPTTSLRGPAAAGGLYGSVEALDEVRNVIARSALVALPRP